MARKLAWVQMGSGALIPGGGAGSLAVGGWLLHLAGMPTRQIVQRSSGLFFLTSAINVLSLGAAGLILLLGIGDGPHDAAWIEDVSVGVPAARRALLHRTGVCPVRSGTCASTSQCSG